MTLLILNTSTTLKRLCATQTSGHAVRTMRTSLSSKVLLLQFASLQSFVQQLLFKVAWKLCCFSVAYVHVCVHVHAQTRILREEKILQ